MKKTLAFLACCFLTAGLAAAQSAELAPAGRANRLEQGRDAMSPEQRADLQTQRLTKQLALSTDQSAQVRTIALAEIQEMQALRGKFAAAGARQGAGQELKAVREKYDAQLKAVLTADQATKYGQLRDEQVDKRKAKIKEGRMKMKS